MGISFINMLLFIFSNYLKKKNEGKLKHSINILFIELFIYLNTLFKKKKRRKITALYKYGN